MNVRSISEIGIESVDARRFETLPEERLGRQPRAYNKSLAVLVVAARLYIAHPTIRSGHQCL